MKLRDSERKAKLKFWLGSIFTLLFGFVTFISILKSFYQVFKDISGVGEVISQPIEKIINWIYSYTDFASIFWKKFYPKLPVLNISQPLQSDNLYFFGLVGLTLFSFFQIQDAFWIRGRINIAKNKVYDKTLEKEIAEQSGHITREKKDLLEIEINIEKPDPWFRKPLGMIIIGVLIAVLGKLVMNLIWNND